MKKFLLWCIPLFICIIVASIVLVIVTSNNSKNVIYATQFSYKYENVLNLKLNDEVTFNKTEFNIQPANCTEKIVLTTNDSEMLQIDNKTNKVIAKKIGTCTLFAQIKSSKTKMLSTQITINITDELDDSDKIIETHDYTFNLLDEVATIEFGAGSTKDENIVTHKSGLEVLSVCNEEYNSITIALNAKGTAIIEIVCNTKKLILNITIV